MTVNDASIGLRARTAAHRGFEELSVPDRSNPGDALASSKSEERSDGGGASMQRTSCEVERRVLAARGDNPFCGDELEVRAVVRRDPARGWVVERAAFDGYACTLCLAASDALMEAAEGQPAVMVRATTFDDVCRLLGGLTVGRTRKGCVELPLTVLGRALAPVVE